MTGYKNQYILIISEGQGRNGIFQFGGFNVYVHELSLAKFVMENAAKLERMTITTAFWLQYSDINMDKVKEQLLSFPKCSTSVSLEFADVNGSSR